MQSMVKSSCNCLPLTHQQVVHYMLNVSSFHNLLTSTSLLKTASCKVVVVVVTKFHKLQQARLAEGTIQIPTSLDQPLWAPAD